MDASALIALFSERDAHHVWARQMFIDTVGWEYQMTAVTQAEVLVHPAKAGHLDQFLDAVRGLRITITPVDGSDSLELAQIRATTNLRMPDVLVLHQAIKVQGSIATSDGGLASVARAMSIGVFRPN